MNDKQQGNNRRNWFLEFLFGKQCEESNEAHIRQITYLEQALSELKQANQTQIEKIRELENTIVIKGNENIELKAIILAERFERQEAQNETVKVKKEVGKTRGKR